MIPARLPDNEPQRVERLHRYAILDTPPEESFDRITRIVAETIGVPIALVSLVDTDRQWFKSRYGLAARQTPREIAFCAHTILDDGIFVVEDTREDERFHDNPLVTSDPNIRFYAGAPLITSDGYKLGSLCAIDSQPRELDADGRQLLEDLAHLVIDEMELRDALRKAVDDAREQERLREAAQSAERSKAQFLASMSHEIRTPLNAVIGLTELLLMTEVTEQQRGYLSRVALAGRNLLSLINDILDFSKIEAGRVRIETIDFEIDDILANMASVTGAKAEEKGIELLFSVAPGIPRPLRGDPLRIGQILINLVSNAVKFTERGEVVVGVDMETDEVGLNWLTVSVADTGIGMSEAETAELFRPFSQADPTIARRYGGTGLGLSISKQLVELMGGSISVRSAKGEGSTFSFRVPLIQSATDRPQPKERGFEPRAMRILVVDDNEAARELLQASLRGMEFEADTAASGAEAVERVAQAGRGDRPYDLLLVDWRMPGMDGIETVRRIRAGVEGAGVIALLMISDLQVDEIAGYLEPLAIAGCVQKPINTSLLFDKVMAALDAASAGGGTPGRLRSAPQSAHAVRDGAMVLLAEDNEMNRLIARVILEGAGFAVDSVGTGRAAVERLEEKGPDFYGAVLMDIQMPEMDGIAATKRIRELAGFAGLPIIAMTAHALDEERERIAAAGLNDHVVKPIDARELVSKLNAWLDRSDPANKGAGKSNGRSESLFDLNEVKQRLPLPEELLFPIIEDFATRYAGVDNRLSELVRSGARGEAAALAHEVRGAAGSVGAARLGALAADVEAALRRRESGGLETLLAALAEALPPTIEAMKTAIAE